MAVLPLQGAVVAVVQQVGGQLVQVQAVQTLSQADPQRSCTVQVAGIAVAAFPGLDQAHIALIVVAVGW